MILKSLKCAYCIVMLGEAMYHTRGVYICGVVGIEMIYASAQYDTPNAR